MDIYFPSFSLSLLWFKLNIPVNMHKLNFYKSIFVLILLSLFGQIAKAQIFINELDSDSPGIDDKEFVEIRTLIPFTSLNGHVLVFFNGNPSSSNANMSYYALSLNGLVTDANGIATLGNNLVSPVPDVIFSDNVIQNGEDALAIYQGSLADFPNNTMATTTNLVHALAYDTSDPDAIALMALLGIVLPQVQVNENENNAQATESIQRKNDGTYEVKAPTPGAMNDGSGFVYNGLTIVVNPSNRDEGDTLHITITSQTPVATPINFNLTLNNGSFNAADFTGNLTCTIPANATTFSTIITLVDDVINEGDEVLKIKFGTLPSGFNRLNDNVEIRVVDNDYQIDPWGTPLQPTYGIVTSSAPAGYYSSLNGLSGQALFFQLRNIIADSTVVRAHCYGDMPELLKEADHNPKNGNQVWLMYVETPRAKLDYQTTGSGTGKWNREHIYPQSRGGFSNGTSDTADGIAVYLPTNANDILAGHADAHALRAEDATENSTRNNKDYGGSDYNGPVGTLNSWRGDVARALLYMSVRYNGLSVVSGNPADTTVGQIGDLDSLLSWHLSDPRDDFEMYRNNYIYTWQYNRNPFIDLPDLVSYLFGANQGQVWNNSSSTIDFAGMNCTIFPNPTSNQFTITGFDGQGELEIWSSLGQLIHKQVVKNQTRIQINQPNGLYILKLNIGGTIGVQKLLIQ